MRDIIEDDELCWRFFALLDERNPRDRCYLYRVTDGKPVRPALFKCTPHPRLIDILRDEFGGGDFQVMIRRGEKMIITGLLKIAEP
jgi:hypothetical protein